MAGLYKDYKGTDRSIKAVLKEHGFKGKKMTGDKGEKFVGYSKSKALASKMGEKKISKKHDDGDHEYR